MKNNKKIMIILLILIVLVILIIVCTLLLKDRTTGVVANVINESDENLLMEYVEDETNIMVEQEKSKTIFATLEDIINNSDSNYKLIKEIFKLNIPVNQAYAVHSKLNTEDVYELVYLDADNATYEIQQLQETDYTNIKNGTIDNKLIHEESIKSNGNNSYSLNVLNDENFATFYYTVIKNLMQSNQMELYNILNTEYRENRFENFEDFTEYCNSMNQLIIDKDLYKYGKSTNNGIEQYICQDDIGTTYIVNVKSNTDIEVLLDDYTIETDDFKTKYESANFQTRVITDADKVMKMINTKDYRAIYNLLDETYKANNFATIDSLINYINTAFYSSNYYTISNVSEQGQYYLVTITCKETAAASADTKENRLIIALGDGTSFKMSFALE